ncbi:hypothetical protein LTR41_004473 [Exophiala xenobiotica]|nr:hypothetical protein LTR41_004473 [Exophiala xenobiotica]
MSLPKPDCSFVIPSIHDDLELDSRIYYPKQSERNHESFGRSFAIFAHPYAPLGGSYDDPLVGIVGSVLLRQGFVLVTFNFRGASGSAGRTTWSGKAELADYVSVYGFVLCCIDAVFRDVSRVDAYVSGTDADVPRRNTKYPILVLGGYSYGSMIAAHLPSLGIMTSLFKETKPGSAEGEIRALARDLGRDIKAYFAMSSSVMNMTVTEGKEADQTTPDKDKMLKSPNHSRSESRIVTMGGYESDAAGHRSSRDRSRRSVDGDRAKEGIERIRRKISHREHRGQHPPTTPSTTMGDPQALSADSAPILPSIAYLLVSPLLSTVARFTTMFSRLRFTPKMGGTGPAPAPAEEFHELTTHPCYCLYGNKDVFTSDRKLRRWTEELSGQAGSQFIANRAETGHFWQEHDAVLQLRQGIAEWIKGLALRSDEEGTEKVDEAGFTPIIQAG